ncbi:hypothetical protein ACFL0W_00410 [Nanoarchaeota archaeon]
MAKITEFGPAHEKFKEEYAEEAFRVFKKTNWPMPLGRARLVNEVFKESIEEIYYWAVTNLQELVHYPIIEKISDVFAASEFSSFFGASEQKLGLQQDKASQFLATIGKMVKEMFQLVRELRMLDERAHLYKSAAEGSEAAEIALKGYWIDMVEQGAKNPSSVYGMAREIEFTALPDLFFSVHPLTHESVSAAVDKLTDFNVKVRSVLKRKIKQFLTWKAFTRDEMANKRTFTLKYLRQHYDIIKMYMDWVKPYLTNIRHLIMQDDASMSKAKSPHLIAAFEGSMIEIELLARKPVDNGKCFFCMNVHFFYRTRPEMGYHQEYQKGPYHLGRTTMTVRTYVWTPEQLAEYKRFKRQDDFDMLALVDESVSAAMQELGDDLQKYLEESGESFQKPLSTKTHSVIKSPSILDPFTSLFSKGTFLRNRGPNLCPKCKAQKTSYYKCLKCSTIWRKPTKDEMHDLQLSKAEAEKLYADDFHHFTRKFKAEHYFVY